MSARINDLADERRGPQATRWPLEDMLGADLVQAALRRIEALTGLRTRQRRGRPALWLKVDSFSLLQALAYLALRLRDEYDIRSVQLRLHAATAGGRSST
jgi:DNA polymerase-3 subunit epsilon